MIIGFVSGVIVYSILSPKIIDAELKNVNTELNNKITLVKNGSPTICKLGQSSYEVVKTIRMMVTAYSSTPDQTDDTPFITASGKDLRTLKEGERIVANNLLPFGTIVEIEGQRYIVEDRMHERKGTRMADVHMETREAAEKWGVKLVDVKVLES
ncbi:MAG: hypothetical protein A2980_02960 [Candidatus Staskawiczbacteria bacterium RIFCSPLOWO2_01_FULL_33_13]|nr:MAG: hypothetical protein A2980_02960 [Candidatus Staskawiczbacteria bacterium RIFCSPLOWO2_01_FULL_33_13]